MSHSACLWCARWMSRDFRGPVAQCRAFGKPFSMARMSTSCSRAVVKHSSLDACLVLFVGASIVNVFKVEGMQLCRDMQVCVQICVLSVLGHPRLDLVPPQKNRRVLVVKSVFACSAV